MFEFEKQRRQQRRHVAWHTDAAAASCIVPFNVHAHKFIASHVALHAMDFLEDTEEVVEVIKAHVFNAKVIHNEAELDGSPLVVPETRY
jgi:hypothetical protein